MQNIFESMIHTLVEILSVLEFSSDQGGQAKLTYSGALGLYNFLSALLKKDDKFKIGFKPEIARVLVAISHSLTKDIKVFSHVTNEIFHEI